MAMMIPVIVPEHTGYLEYCSNETAWTIPVVTKAASTQEGPIKRLYEGSNWVLPDFDTSILIMKLAVEDKKEAQLKASAAYANVLQKFTWDKVVDQLEKLLLEYSGS
jgi:glycosyltransferase involved in cell wall biosynthesis